MIRDHRRLVRVGVGGESGGGVVVYGGGGGGGGTLIMRVRVKSSYF